jgi:hypothetical protein
VDGWGSTRAGDGATADLKDGGGAILDMPVGIGMLGVSTAGWGTERLGGGATEATGGGAATGCTGSGAVGPSAGFTFFFFLIGGVSPFESSVFFFFFFTGGVADGAADGAGALGGAAGVGVEEGTNADGGGATLLAAPTGGGATLEPDAARPDPIGGGAAEATGAAAVGAGLDGIGELGTKAAGITPAVGPGAALAFDRTARFAEPGGGTADGVPTEGDGLGREGDGITGIKPDVPFEP